MSIIAYTGPVITFPANPGTSLTPALSGPANQNPQSAPNMFHHGYSLIDPRYPFTYFPGGDVSNKVYGFFGTSKLQVLDQAPSAIADNNISASASPGAAALTLVSSSGAGITVSTSITNAVSGATVTGLLAIDTAMAGVGFGQDATVNMWDPTKAVARNVRITSGSDDSGITFTVSGYDLYGYPMSEAITGANAGIASGKKAFKYISAITHTGSVAGTVKAGTGDVYGLPLRADRAPYLEVWWGNPQSLEVSNLAGTVAGQQTLTIPIPLLTNLADGKVYNSLVPFDFTLVSAAFYTGLPVTTGSKAATLTMQVNGTSVGTGGVMALTSAALTPTGAVVPATTISGANTSGTGAKSAVTITIATPGVISWPSHTLAAGTPVSFATTGALPTGLTAGTIYYVIAGGLATNAFEVSATVGGSAVNTSGTQSGVHTATAYQTVGFVVSSTTAFVEGNGYVDIVVQNNDITGGTFTAAVTTTASTTTGDTRGTIALPSASDGTKRLTVFETISVANVSSTTGLFGVAQNSSSNNGT